MGKKLALRKLDEETPPAQEQEKPSSTLTLRRLDEELVKKKDLTSQDGSGSSKPADQPSKPSEQSTEKPQPTKQAHHLVPGQKLDLSALDWTKPKDTAGAIVQPAQVPEITPEKFSEMQKIVSQQEEAKADFEKNKETNPAKSFGKSLWGVLRYDIPSSAVAMAAAAGDTSGGTLGLTGSSLRQATGKTTAEQEGLMEVKKKLNMILTAQEFQQEGAEYRKYLVNSLDKISDPIDAINWVSSALGQATGQIPAAALTGGGSSMVQEIGSIYLDGVTKIAEEQGISVEQVIQEGKDDSLYPLVFGATAAVLDRLGAKGVMQGFSKQSVMAGMRDRAIASLKAGGKEALTEGAQTTLESIGLSKASGKTWGETIDMVFTEDFGRQFIESVAQGAIGGTGLHSAGQVIKNVLSSKAPLDNQSSIQQAAQQVQESIDNEINQQENAGTIREDQGPVPQEGKVDQEGQGDSGQNVQQDQVQPPGEGDAQAVEQAQDAGQVATEDQKAGTTKVTVLTEEGGKKLSDIKTRLDSQEITKEQAKQEIDAVVNEGGAAYETAQQQEPQSASGTESEGSNVQTNGQKTDQGESNQGKGLLTETQQPEPSVQETATPADVTPKERQYKIAQRIEQSENVNEAIKKGIKEKGDTYIPKSIDVTQHEANEIVDHHGEDKAETIVRDTKNSVTADTRTALAASLFDRYSKAAESTTDPELAQRYRNKAVSIALFGSEHAKELGRGVNAAKLWKRILGSGEETVSLAIEKGIASEREKALGSINIPEIRAQLEAEIRAQLETQVQSTIEERVKKAKLISTEQKKKISDAFDKLKIKGPEGTLQASTLLPEVWNGAIEVIKKAVLTGADVANAVQAGIDYIKSHHKGDFDEGQFRNRVSPVIESNLIFNEDKKKARIEKQIAEYERRIKEQDFSPMKQRGEKKSSDLQDKLDDLRKQYQELKKQSASKTISPDKVKTPKISGKRKKNFIADVVDAYNNGELTDDKVEELYAKQLGVKTLEDADRKKISELAKVIVDAEKFQNDVKDNFTPENIKKYKQLFRDAQKANKALQEYAAKSHNLADTWATMIQGSLLTPLSLVTNIYSNILLQNLRFFSMLGGTLSDKVQQGLATLGVLPEAYKKASVDPIALQRGFFEGTWNGTKEGLYQMGTGALAGEDALREVQAAFNPAAAIARWADSDRRLSQKINDYVEGTIGWAPEVMFRLLNLGDKPFRRAAELARAREIGEKQGLKGEELAKFMMFPDEATAKEMKHAGDLATFQGEGPTVMFNGKEIGITDYIDQQIRGFINLIGSIPVVGPTFKVLAKSQVPYVRTPLNIFFETLDYAAPPLTFVRGLYEITHGKRRSGNLLIGKAMTGFAIYAVAKILFRNDLLTPDEPDKEKKSLQYDTVQPNSFNMSAYIRGMSGFDWETQDGDIWMSYEKMGPIGMLFNMYATIFNEQEKTGSDLEIMDFQNYGQDLLATAPRTMAAALDQTYLQGTNTLLTALKEGGNKMDSWLINTAQAVTSPLLPNTLATVSKASDEFIRDTRESDLMTRFAETYKTKLFMGEQLAPRINLWGEPIKGNPEGRNKFMWYLFDTTKFVELDTDSWKWKLYEAMRADLSETSGQYVPTEPRASFVHNGVKIDLTTRQRSELSKEIGSTRATLTMAYVTSSRWEKDTPEVQKERLTAIYREGYEKGKRRFLINQNWLLLPERELEKINQKDVNLSPTNR